MKPRKSDDGLSKKTYEDGMARAFQVCHEALWNRNGDDRTGPLRALFDRRDALLCRWQ